MAANPFPTFALGPLNNPVPGSTRAPKPHSTPLGQLDPTALKMRLQQLSNADPSLTDPHFTGKVPGVLGPSDYSGYLDHLTDQQDYARDEDAIAGKAGPTINTGAYDGTDGVGGGAGVAPKAPAANPALAGLTAALGPPGKVKTSASRAVGSDATGEDPGIAGVAYSQLHTQDPDLQPENIVRRLRDLGLMGDPNSESSFQAERAQTEQSRQAGRLPFQVAQDTGDAATRLDQTQNNLQDTDAIRGAQRASFAPVAQQTVSSQLAALALAHANHPGTAGSQGSQYGKDPVYTSKIDTAADAVQAGKMTLDEAVKNYGGMGTDAHLMKSDISDQVLKRGVNPIAGKLAEQGAVKAQPQLRLATSAKSAIEQFLKDADAQPDYANTGSPLINRGSQLLGGASENSAWSDPHIAQAQTSQKMVADTLAKFFQGGGTGNATSDAKLRMTLGMLNTGQPSASRHAAGKTLEDMMDEFTNASSAGTVLGAPGSTMPGGGGAGGPAGPAGPGRIGGAGHPNAPKLPQMGETRTQNGETRTWGMDPKTGVVGWIK